jgi:hypothetical protein
MEDRNVGGTGLRERQCDFQGKGGVGTAANRQEDMGDRLRQFAFERNDITGRGAQQVRDQGVARLDEQTPETFFLDDPPDFGDRIARHPYEHAHSRLRGRREQRPQLLDGARARAERCRCGHDHQAERSHRDPP